jgi:hypothetical protein
MEFAFTTVTPMFEESVQSVAPRATVKFVGSAPNFETEPRAVVAALVPRPLGVPPAESMVRLIELTTVPVTASDPVAVSWAEAEPANVTKQRTAAPSAMCFEVIG